MTLFNILLALHLLAVVWWIGGVAFVTAVALPSFNRLADGERVARIHEIERRFAWQARVAVLVAGGSGLWMLILTGGIARLHAPGSGWLQLMIGVWALFAFMLFVAEPLRLPARAGLIHRRAAFLLIHAVLLALALLTVFCGVIGTRGGFVN